MTMNELEIAFFDLDTAKSELERGTHEGNIRIAAYHVQQALEKTFKFILVTRKFRVKKVHDLTKLVAHLIQSGYSVSNDVISMCAELTKWEAASRYNFSFSTNVKSVSANLRVVEKFLKLVASEYGVKNPVTKK